MASLRENTEPSMEFGAGLGTGLELGLGLGSELG